MQYSRVTNVRQTYKATEESFYTLELPSPPCEWRWPRQWRRGRSSRVAPSTRSPAHQPWQKESCKFNLWLKDRTSNPKSIMRTIFFRVFRRLPVNAGEIEQLGLLKENNQNGKHLFSREMFFKYGFKWRQKYETSIPPPLKWRSSTGLVVRHVRRERSYFRQRGE